MIFSIAPVSETWTSPFSLYDGLGVLAGLVHLLEHGLCDLGADHAVVDHLDHARKPVRPQRAASISLLSAFKSRISSPIIQFETTLGWPESFTASSK